MKEEEPSWFARWEDDLPSPEELMPLTQTLITPDLALAFDIPSTPESAAAAAAAAEAAAVDFLRHGIHSQQDRRHHNSQQKDPSFPSSSRPSPAQSHQGPSSQLQQQQPLGGQAAPDYDSSELGGAGSGGGGGGEAGCGGDEQARTLKRPRLVWTPQLHKRFVDAVAHLGIKNAVPKTIMQLMSVEGLTRENVASHLQKYRLYLKRMQGLSGGAGGAVGPLPHADQATEQLFASGPIPHPLLQHRGPTPAPGAVGTPDQFFPFASMGSLHPHQPQSHQQQMAAAAAAAAAAANYHQQQQQQYYRQHHRQQQMLGSPPGSGYDHGFLTSRQQPQPQPQHRHHPAALQRMMEPVGGIGMGTATGFGEELEPGGGPGGGSERRKELTLFPTNDG